MRLTSCSSCQSFVPPNANQCRFCGCFVADTSPSSGVTPTAPTAKGRAAGVLAMAGFSLTMMACYGPPTRKVTAADLVPAKDKPTQVAADPSAKTEGDNAVRNVAKTTPPSDIK
jgi:hypothetical protein